MNTWVSRGLDAALAGKMDPRVTDHDITIMSLFIFATSPLTWMILYVAAEGSIRLVGAAFAESSLGILPLFVADKIFLQLTGQSGLGHCASRGLHRDEPVLVRRRRPRESSRHEDRHHSRRALRHTRRRRRVSGNSRLPEQAGLDAAADGAVSEHILPAGGILSRLRAAALPVPFAALVCGRHEPHRFAVCARSGARGF